MTPHEINDLLIEARRLWLAGWYLLKDTQACMKECNGTGADWMPKFIRKFLDFILRLFAPAVAIHDRRYAINTGNRHRWDDEFETNCRTIARDKYTWCHPMRYICYWVARKLRIALTIGGEIAWIQAGKAAWRDQNYFVHYSSLNIDMR